MDITKAAQPIQAGTPTQQQLAAINALAKGTLTAEQVFVFALRLCDDQIDRDGERFDTAALPQLARLFVGKTGVLDHQWSTEHQVARIFDTEVMQEDGVTFIKAWAYMRRGGSADELIADIEAGIKKEVSVGCAMGRSVCSICGSDIGTCGHQKGETYDGVRCCAILRDPVDAYEFSFVAVPAQREAGILKGRGTPRSLKELSEMFGAQAEYRELHKLASLGQQYQKQTEDDVVRLLLTLDLGVEEPVLRAIASRADGDSLMTLKAALEQRVAELLPVQSQLHPASGAESQLESSYLI